MSEKMCKDNKELAEYIANHLPISFEDALDFVEGSLMGGMLTDKINFTIALATRERMIQQLLGEISYWRRLKTQ